MCVKVQKIAFYSFLLTCAYKFSKCGAVPYKKKLVFFFGIIGCLATRPLQQFFERCSAGRSCISLEAPGEPFFGGHLHFPKTVFFLILRRVTRQHSSNL